MLVALLLLNLYRAATQSLVHDEAFTWKLYVAAPLLDIFRVYDANHHFLSTLLIRLSAALFGTSELALRLPSVLAGGVYFVALYRLNRLVFGDTLLFLLTTALAAANPIVLDFLVAARGYGLALALFTWGLYYAVAGLSGVVRPQVAWQRAGGALALSITANLTLLVPVAVVAGMLIALFLRGRDRAAATHFGVPMAVIAALFVFIAPIRQATAGNFYVGAPTLQESLHDLSAVSLAHNTGPLGWNQETSWTPWWRWFVVAALTAVVLTGLAIEFPRLRRGIKAAASDWLLLFASAAIAGSWVLLIVMHLAVRMPYPVERTGLYFLPLGALAFGAALASRSKAALRRVATAGGVIVALQFFLQLNWTHFYIWRYDADTRTMVRLLAANSSAHMRAGVSWQLEPSVNYYRARLGLQRLDPVTRDGPDGDYDYYLLIESDQDRIAARHLRVLYRGTVSGTVLGAR